MGLFQSACSKAVLLIHRQVLKVHETTGRLPKVSVSKPIVNFTESLRRFIWSVVWDALNISHIT